MKTPVWTWLPAACTPTLAAQLELSSGRGRLMLAPESEMSEPKQGSSRQTRREANQLERLFDLLPNDAYDVVAKLLYASRVQIGRWYAREADRLAPVMGKVVAGVQHRTPAVTEH